MPKTILTTELPCIPRAITTNTAAKSKVTIKSPLSVIGQIKNWLTKSDQDVFKHYSQLGRLLDLDTKGLFPGTLVNQIVLRRVDCQKRHELWFLINGKPVRFSLQEFAIVSGLYTDGGPTPEEMELVSSKNKLKEKYFKNIMSIKVTDVANALDSISRESKTRERVKLCFIYLLSAFLIMPSPSSAIDLEWLQLVDNLPIFDNYCWGKLAYEKIIEQITKKDMKNNPSEKDIKWNLFSCPWIFLIWICEAMPKLGEMVGQRVPGNHIPRWLGWKINDKHKNVTVTRLSEVIENNTEFFVRPTLAPTSKEKAELFYERLGSYEDNEDDVIDQISSFLVGDVILRNQQCVAPHVEPPSSNVGQSNMEPPSSDFEHPTNDVEPPQFTQIPQQSHLHPSSQPPSSYDARNDLLESVKCLIAEQEKLHKSRYEEIERVNRERYETIMTTISDHAYLNTVRHETILTKLDDLTRIFRPIAAQFSGAGGEKTTENNQQDSPSHAHFFGDGFVTPARERNMEGDQVSTLVGEKTVENTTSNFPTQLIENEVTTQSHVSANSYETPPSIIYEGVNYEEPGDEVEQIVRDGRPLRLRKRAASLKSPFTPWPRKRRYSKLEPPTFDPFRQPIEEDVQAFFRWYNGDTNGRRTIRCGQTSHDISFFEILLAKQRYIDSEHVDEITYLFRKRMDKFHNIFPKDICILTDEFGQRVRALYKESREENNNVCKTNEELMMFVEGTRPIRGRIWSDVNYFYVPWHDGKHWMLVVVDRHSWTILIYDSIPDHWNSIEAMKKSVEPLAAYFPFLLKNSCHIGSLHHQCSDLMSIKVAPANTVPLNKRTGDCGVFMLKTMEMHIAGKCNESATMLLNDDNIDTYRKAYAVQLYVGSADP
ncbi:hypothetical protein G4B88_014647 [Cannabis sativa]|uniref:Ubiquitin-like protease family profile domain-containing protein n=1 Tax=Cannabis sativa TaxID=3483 RepID=A0A7J6IAU8_CANSA|nr:hypothetical protein G4B88_014647 [Cannabis sativa]